MQLATRTKRKVTHKLLKTVVNLNGYENEMHLNIFPLGSYDLLVGMDWLEKHKEIVNWLEKTIHCIDDEGKVVIEKGKLKPISVRKISTLQLKWTITKGCQVYVVQVEELGHKKKNRGCRKLTSN